jgi:hypothetical protein
MSDDRDLLIGKWKVWVKSWVWEYEFSPDGTVTWRDPSSFEKGSGRWAMSPSLVNISWTDSVTKESWQRSALIGGKNNKTYYSSPYFTGPYYVEKILFDLPKTIQPDPEIEIDLYDPQTEPNYIDALCTHVAYGIYNGGFWVYVPEVYSPHPIEIPEHLVWFNSNFGTRESDKIYDSQASALQALGGRATADRVAFYEGVGGKIICPTAFTLKTAPTIVNTASIVADELVESIKSELMEIMGALVLRIAVSTTGAVIGRTLEVRRLKAREARAKAALANARARQASAVGRPSGGPDQFDMHRYSWPGGDQVSFKKEGNAIVVDYVKRVKNPPGSGGRMLAEGIKAGGNAKPDMLHAPNILQKDPNSNVVIENLLRDCVEALGGRVSSVQKGIDGTQKHFIKMSIAY